MQQYLQSWVCWGQNRQNNQALVKRLGTCKNAVEYFRKRHIYLHYIQVCICLCKTNTSYLSLSIPSKPETSKFQGYHRCPKSQMQNPVLLHRHSRYGSQHPAGYKYPAPNIALSLDNIHTYIYIHTHFCTTYMFRFNSFPLNRWSGMGQEIKHLQIKTLKPFSPSQGKVNWLQNPKAIMDLFETTPSQLTWTTHSVFIGIAIWSMQKKNVRWDNGWGVRV